MGERKRCGAKTRSGGKCRKWAMENGRCKLHGGLSTGAPEHNQNATKHGIYSKYFTAEEQADAESIELGAVDAELKLLRIQLMRALKYQLERDRKKTYEEQLDIEFIEHKQNVELGEPVLPQDDTEVSAIPAVAEIKKKMVKTDIDALILKYVARIESLERTRKVLDTSGDNEQLEELKALLDDD